MAHRNFFQRLNHSVDKVICYDHLYAPVDDTYFEEIMHRVDVNAQRYLSYNNADDIVKMEAFEARLGLNTANCHPFMM